MRYLLNFDTSQLKSIETDVLVVGSGIAGLFTALNLKPDLSVQLIAKQDMTTNNSYLAQGGIAVTFDPEEFASHIQDTLRAGAFYNDPAAVQILVEEGRQNVEKLMRLGVDFDRVDGQIDFTKEGGHSARRIIHSKDFTGKAIIEQLSRVVMNRTNVSISENAFLVDVLVQENRVTGALVMIHGELHHVATNHVVLATGGIGKLFVSSTNASISTGDGIAVARRAGAEIKDMEFIQFHPTPFNGGEQAFLISEAVRGEGGILRNAQGQAFMKDYHEMADLAPRDIVSRAIIKERENQGSQKIFLDVTHMPEGFFESRFPSIFSYCMQRGIDPRVTYIPISPAEHYLMGGIMTDLDGQTNIIGLHACGESARTGVQGANRLASNSLSEGIVFGNRIAESINRDESPRLPSTTVRFGDLRPESVDCHGDRQRLRQLMESSANILRRISQIEEAMDEVRKMRTRYEQVHDFDRAFMEFKNMLQVAELILQMALNRPESLGGHYVEVDGHDESMGS